MKRIRRWLFAGLAVVSLLFFSTALLAYILSFHQLRTFSSSGGEPANFVGLRFTLSFEQGDMELTVDSYNYPIDPLKTWTVASIIARKSYLKFRGFQWDSSPIENGIFTSPPQPYIASHRTRFGKSVTIGQDNYFQINLFWPLSLSLGMAITSSLVACRCFLRRRHVTDLCENCGYDLRATPNQCPECGRVPKTLKNSN